MISIGCSRVLVAKDSWEKLEGSFSLTSMPKRAVIFLEGPPPGVDMLIDSVTVSCEVSIFIFIFLFSIYLTN